MASRLDQALDDVIKDRRRDKHHSNRRSHGGRRSDTGPIRKRSEPVVRSFIRTMKIQGSSQRGRGAAGGRDVNSPWAHDRFEDDVPQRESFITSRLGPRNDNRGVELSIENLHYNVTEQDVLELFSTVGPVEKARLFYDRSGRSTGQAKVKYASSSDADKAIKKFDNVELDGQPMKIEISQPSSNRLGRNSGGRSLSDRLGNRQGRSSGKNREERTTKTAEDLDKEMDNYMNQNEQESAMALD
ncbi:hypothetical protein G6F46_010019 [Rhizopus delemar]|uniref:RRM domain-containing protein n=3 Tax=Rhizopus TaxID=4842 RepID=I1BJX6_RHIO9|nr:hypothetical protein RO3G_01210 [Rhizopus delemar RA 99-880]KAG1465332.1 hypothetical protein G6F55_001209 [Rhizopus delemar]KAG1548769.1 hypothetical protein G6F51_003458 [Rhizopus arrhizus]KAG1493413.1 hypothetical protein G6F54_008593 [Rhizopus delemar]KAG1506291.1 hypothetical protein G6F53_009796 [Rhizopus delemar]|eukprot:EIE76506.1 hypothetical protein RO3G_01210 [Rhizopus delemar RA 99-880]